MSSFRQKRRGPRLKRNSMTGYIDGGFGNQIAGYTCSPVLDGRSAVAKQRCCLHFILSELLANPTEVDALLEQVGTDCLRATPRTNFKLSQTALIKHLQNLQLKPGIWGMGYDLKPHLISFGIPKISRRPTGKLLKKDLLGGSAVLKYCLFSPATFPLQLCQISSSEIRPHIPLQASN